MTEGLNAHSNIGEAILLINSLSVPLLIWSVKNPYTFYQETVMFYTKKSAGLTPKHCGFRDETSRFIFDYIAKQYC